MLVLTGTTLNVMSLMGVVMLAGIAMSNSILIVEFAHHLKMEGSGVGEAIIESCRVRLRPILMTSLATIIGLMPMALKLGEGSESYAPLARALIGGLLVSVASRYSWCRRVSRWPIALQGDNLKSISYISNSNYGLPYSIVT